jgi:uncharacterized membrane protein
MSSFALFIAIFTATAVEAVEAVTIVLAAGTARDWRSALQGTFSGLGVLALIVLILGPFLPKIPLDTLRLVVGVVLLVFGLQWLRKAILRASGRKALHDEEAIYQRELAAARIAKADKRFGVHDWYAFVLSFKGVLLEGFEVVFIVVTFGAVQKREVLASVAAFSAVLIVTLFGFAVRKPMARVPENQMKYFVGCVLTSFGVFWGFEGLGLNWPHGDVALLVILPVVFVVSLILVGVLKQLPDRPGKIHI